jgi:hypothetical protein
MRTLTHALPLAACLLVGGSGLACADVVRWLQWWPDSIQAGLDTSRPRRPEVRVDGVRRGYDYRAEKRGWVDGAALGCLQLGVRGEDDRTPLARLGYRIELVGGELPPRLQLPGFPVSGLTAPQDTVSRPFSRVFLFWVDWAEGEVQHPLRFALRVTCLDKSGNESAPSDTVWVLAPPR